MSKLADSVAEYIAANYEREERVTTSAIAEALGEDVVLIGFVLDSYQAREDGAHYVGTGAGGGWVPVQEETQEEQLTRQLEDNVISQKDYDLRMELIKRGKDPRDAVAMQELIAERTES